MARNIQVRLFGAFRSFSQHHRLRMTVNDRATVADLRRALAHVLCEPAAARLLENSAFSTDEQILCPHDRLPESGTIHLLPPVSGG